MSAVITFVVALTIMGGVMWLLMTIFEKMPWVLYALAAAVAGMLIYGYPRAVGAALFITTGYILVRGAQLAGKRPHAPFRKAFDEARTAWLVIGGTFVVLGYWASFSAAIFR